MEQHSKIQDTHLKWKAILYIRQSTMRQVYENTESTLRQYALHDKLVRLGWNEQMIEVIDCDLGQSGADMKNRQGFRQMLADVGEGRVGAIASIECSRLSRSCGDWGRLTEICGLGRTLLIDDDGVYDPNDFNDRLLLGLKGTMSEAELHFLHERMRGGALNKASRGELKNPLPVGYLYDEGGRIVKDPDLQVQSALELFFRSFRICGSAHRLATYYGEKGFRFPTDRNRGQAGMSDIYWEYLTPSRAAYILKSPTYAGIYVYGRMQSCPAIAGNKRKAMPVEKWHSYIEGHHDAYISIEDYNTNRSMLAANSTKKNSSAPREENALLQGIVVCAKCGRCMGVSYKKYGERLAGTYHCVRTNKGEPFSHDSCICISSRAVDQAVEAVLLEKLTPEAVRSAHRIQKELEKRQHDSDNFFALQVEKARYEAELARKRYMNADPENRLVCSELERIWNEKMGILSKCESELKRHERDTAESVRSYDLAALSKFPEKFKEAWHADSLDMVTKKRLLRCLIQDVTLRENEGIIQAGIRFSGGAEELIEVQRPPKKYETWTTSPEIVEYIRSESKRHTVEEIVALLNNSDKKSGKGKSFSPNIVRGIQYHYKIPSLKQYLRSIGYLSTEEKAVELGITPNALNKRRISGAYCGEVVKTTAGGDYMYRPSV